MGQWQTDSQSRELFVYENPAAVINVGNILRETQIETDQELVWDDSDLQDTQKTYTYTQPERSCSEYQLIVNNPSTVSDLTIKVLSVELDLASGTKNALITTLTIPKAATETGTSLNTYVKTINGIFNGTDCLLVFSNDTVLDVSDGFTSTFRLKELK